MQIAVKQLLFVLIVFGSVSSIQYSAHQPVSSVVAVVDAQDATALKLKTELISLQVAVTNRHGQAIAGLTKGDFRIYEDNIQQSVSFFSDEDSPASIAVVVDTSHSMGNDKIDRAREAVARFVQVSHADDEFSLITFDDHAHLVLERTRNSEALLQRISSIKTGGNTALYDGVALGIETISHGAYTKRAVILVSDGEDNRSRVTFNQLHRTLQETNVAIYTIQLGIPLPHSMSRVIMGQLASASGGRSFMPRDGEGMTEAFEQIALELRRLYSIGYIPSHFVADGQWHRIRVVVTANNTSSQKLVVRSREGYYARKDSIYRHVTEHSDAHAAFERKGST